MCTCAVGLRPSLQEHQNLHSFTEAEVNSFRGYPSGILSIHNAQPPATILRVLTLLKEKDM